MPEELFAGRLKRFHERHFPRYAEVYRRTVAEGQHPKVLFIGCSDSRIVPHMIMGAGPGELFIVRNVGNLVPPYDPDFGLHGTGAAVEFATLTLGVSHIIVCGHSHCGAVRALYQDLPEAARHTRAWLELARDAALPVRESEEALRRTEQRSVILQLERLMTYPMVSDRVARGELFLHGWHYLIESGEVLVLDVSAGRFVPAEPLAQAEGEPDAYIDPLHGDMPHA